MPETGLKLLTLRAPAPQFDPSKGVEGLPQRILVMPWGEHQTTEGKVIVNDTTLKQLSAYNASRNWDRPALDFEHSSVPGSATYKGEPVKVAGYGKLEVVQGEGIYLLMSSWTPEGQEFAAGGHYGDLSPVVKTNDKGEVIGLHSAALCRHGATPGLIFLSASPSSSMNKPPQNAEELFAALRTALNLGADATPEQTLVTLTSKLTEATKLAQKTEPEKKEGAEPDVKTLSATVIELRDSFKALSDRLAATEREGILAAAAREGKVVPKAAEGMPLEDLKKLCAELPVTVPLHQRTPSKDALMLSSTQAASPELAEIDRLTGVSDDDVKKYNT